MVNLLGNVFDHEVKETGIRTALDLILPCSKNVPGRTSISIVSFHKDRLSCQGKDELYE